MVNGVANSVEQARPQLELAPSTDGRTRKQKPSLLDQRYFGKSKRDHVKEFACLFGAIFSGIGAYLAYHGHLDFTLGYIAATLVIATLGYKAPIILYPVWSAWMAFAHGLGIAMSFVFVVVTWVIMAVPLAYILRVIGKDVMDLSFDRSVESYWEDREDRLHNFKLLERQF